MENQLSGDIYSNLSIALRPFLRIPVTVASREHSFTTLMLVKNYLWSSIEQGRLRDLALLSADLQVRLFAGDIISASILHSFYVSV